MGFENNAFPLATGTSVNQYGPRGIQNEGGEMAIGGKSRQIRKRFELSTLALTFTDILQETGIPAGAIISSSTTRVVTAAVGATAAVNFGLYYVTGGVVTALDADGLDAAIATATLTPIGAEVAGDGALVNTQLATTANSYYIGADYDTAAFTAGEVEVIVEWFMPVNQGV